MSHLAGRRAPSHSRVQPVRQPAGLAGDRPRHRRGAGWSPRSSPAASAASSRGRRTARSARTCPKRTARRPGGRWSVVRLLVFVLTWFVLALPLLDAIGVPLALGTNRRATREWLLASGVRVAIIVIVAWLVLRVALVMTTRIERELSQGEGLDVLERTKRAQTLGRLVHNVLAVLVGSIALLMVLRELGHRHRPDADRRRDRGRGPRVRRAVAGARRDRRVLPDPREPGARRRRGRHQRRRRRRRGHQPAHDRAAGCRGHRARLPERRASTRSRTARRTTPTTSSTSTCSTTRTWIASSRCCARRDGRSSRIPSTGI